MAAKHLVLVFLIFLFAFILRVLFLGGNSLTFGYDQARDAIHATQIANGDLKILGPSSSTPGLYHGALYYYVLAPAYALGDGNPIVAAYWIAFINALVTFIVFYLAYMFTKNIKAGFFAAIFYALSFEATQYATWLSNPTIAIFSVPLMYLGLWQWLKEKKLIGAVLAGIGLGFSIQAEIFLLYHIVPALIWILVSRKNVSIKSVIYAVVSLVIATSTMILVEFKFGFKSVGGFLSLLSSNDPITSTKSLGDTLLLYLNQLGKVFAYSTYPGNITYGSMIVIVLLFFALRSWNKKGLSWQPFLASWLFSHSTVVSVGGTSTPFLLVGIAPAVSLLLGIMVGKFWQGKQKLLALALVILIAYGNISMIRRENPKGQTIFAIQKDMLLSKQLAAVDYTYEQSQGKPFSVNSLTSPLWINIVWTYLYKWHGHAKYGYVPYWHGRDQVGQLDTLGDVPKDVTNYYLILEPMAGIPMQYLGETIGWEDTKSALVEEKSFGELKVQKRTKI